MKTTVLTAREEQARLARRKKLARRGTRWVWAVIRLGFLVGLGYVILYPILYMISTAFRDIQDYYDPSIAWIPKHFTLDNFKTAMEIMNFGEALKNSLVFSLVAVVIQTFMSSFIGYGFARFQFRGKGIMLMIVILTIIVPNQTIIIPLYEQFRYFDFWGLLKIPSLFTGESYTVPLTNTGWIFYLPSLLGVGIRSGLFLLIFMQFFRGFPRSIDEAALIDGCGPLNCYFRVMLPNARNSLITVFLFSLVWHWNDFYYSGMLLSSKLTLPLALADLPVKIQSVATNTEDPVANAIRVQAGALLVILPLIVVFVFGQRYFTESAERTGLVE